jgi:hypothetical protein
MERKIDFVACDVTGDWPAGRRGRVLQAKEAGRGPSADRPLSEEQWIEERTKLDSSKNLADRQLF